MNVWNAFLIELEVLTLLLIKHFVITHTLYYMKSLLSQQHSYSYNYHALYTMHEFNSCIATNWLTILVQHLPSDAWFSSCGDYNILATLFVSQSKSEPFIIIIIVN